MIDDSERREVARRLRELDYADLQESLICAYLDALGIEGYADWVGIAHRLSDLIEPSCDRDALLELADEFDGKADYIASCIESMDGDFDMRAVEAEAEQREYARRIRDACWKVAE